MKLSIDRASSLRNCSNLIIGPVYRPYAEIEMPVTKNNGTETGEAGGLTTPFLILYRMFEPRFGEKVSKRWNFP